MKNRSSALLAGSSDASAAALTWYIAQMNVQGKLVAHRLVGRAGHAVLRPVALAQRPKERSSGYANSLESALLPIYDSIRLS